MLVLHLTLKELEEVCTKFLKYRIDSKNLVHFLKNTTKYDTPDIKEVVISRFVKDTAKLFHDRVTYRICIEKATTKDVYSESKLEKRRNERDTKKEFIIIVRLYFNLLHMPYHIGIASETLNITKFTGGVLKQLDEGKNEFDGKFEAKEITNKLSNPFSSPHQFCGEGVAISLRRSSRSYQSC